MIQAEREIERRITVSGGFRVKHDETILAFKNVLRADIAVHERTARARGARGQRFHACSKRRVRTPDCSACDGSKFAKPDVFDRKVASAAAAIARLNAANEKSPPASAVTPKAPKPSSAMPPASPSEPSMKL